MNVITIDQLKEYIDEFLSDTVVELGKLKDDCTMLAMEII